ncbi:MAG: thiol-disulfide oxidoreductase DCC family protein [Ferruginibacter sp.]
MMKADAIILFDGICNLCNGSVQYVIKHDPHGIFKFAALQSEAGQKILQQYNLPGERFNSFILIENGRVFTRSTAALRVVKRLKGFSKLLYAFIIIPAFIRNFVYDFIAKNRYRWFGKKESCMIPTAWLMERFLK